MRRSLIKMYKAHRKDQSGKERPVKKLRDQAVLVLDKAYLLAADKEERFYRHQEQCEVRDKMEILIFNIVTLFTAQVYLVRTPCRLRILWALSQQAKILRVPARMTDKSQTSFGRAGCRSVVLYARMG